MRQKFERGARYAVKFKLPTFIQPKAAIALLKGKVSNVVIGGVARGVTTFEATWTGPAETFDSSFLLEVTKLS